jgi:ADP-heptose:LPS heptosyltransferase
MSGRAPRGGRGRILVVHPGALGDVLQAVPALRLLARDGSVTFCGQPRLGELIAGAGVVDEAVSFDSFGLEALFTAEPPPAPLAQRLARFDRVVSWFGSRDDRYPTRLSALARAPTIARPVPARERPVTVWQHLVSTLGPDRAVDRATLRPLVVPQSWIDRAREAIAEAGLRDRQLPVLVHAGAGGQWKVPPAKIVARAIAVAARVCPMLVHVGPADREAAARLVRALDAPVHLLVEPPLTALAGALALARGYIGGDSGVSHLAAAVGAAAVILYPPATLDAWAPWSATARCVPLASPDAAERAAAALADAISASRRSGP